MSATSRVRHLGRRAVAGHQGRSVDVSGVGRFGRGDRLPRYWVEQEKALSSECRHTEGGASFAAAAKENITSRERGELRAIPDS